MEIRKTADEKITGTPGEDDLALIHKHTRRKLKADEVYVFSVKLCDNEIDRDGERFTSECLRGLAGLFIGKTGILNHSGKTEDQVMRIYDTFMEAEPERRNSLGENYTALCAKAYIPRSQGNAALINEIDAGIKKEVSVSCAVRHVKCSVCGKGFGRDSCTHKKGQKYGEATCHAVLEEPMDAYEFSFVAIPAQPAAGVLRKRQEARGRKQENEELERLAEDGRAYRAELLGKAVKAGVTAMPELERALLEAMCANLPTAQLRQLHNTLREKAAKSLPVYSQLQGAVKQNDNESFRI